MERKELICIGCPLGCNLTVEMDGVQVISVSGNTCKRARSVKEISPSPADIPKSFVPISTFTIVASTSCSNVVACNKFCTYKISFAIATDGFFPCSGILA